MELGIRPGQYKLRAIWRRSQRPRAVSHLVAVADVDVTGCLVPSTCHRNPRGDSAAMMTAARVNVKMAAGAASTTISSTMDADLATALPVLKLDLHGLISKERAPGI